MEQGTPFEDYGGLPPLDHSIRELEQYAFGKAPREAYQDGVKRRKEFLNALRHGMATADALAHVGVRLDALKSWRTRRPEFKAEMEGIMLERQVAEDPLGKNADFTFEEFRLRFLRRPTPAYQREITEAYQTLPPGNILLILIPPEHGKGLALWTPIPTPTGWKKMGDLSEGDVIFAGDGTPTKVTYVSPTRKIDCYQVAFSDGSRMVCDSDHLWLTRTRKPQHGLSVKGMDEIAASVMAHGRPNHGVPVGGAFDLPAADLTIDPYLLGIWLGDGSTDAARISTSDPEVITAFEERGYTVRHINRYDYAITGEAKWSRDSSFRSQLRALGVLGEKSVPRTYMRASYLQRLALLQGLMDSDGTCSKTGQCFFENTNEKLAKQAAELVRSLGIKARLYGGRATLAGVDKGPKYRVSFYPRTPVFRLERKANRQLANVDNDRDRWLMISGVEPYLSVETRCIQVAHPSGLFIAGEQMVATHNTTIFEDYATYRLAMNPNYRIVVGCGTQRLAAKVLGRIKNRMEPEGPFKMMVDRFGPFAPQNDTGRKTRQPWGANYFNVAKKASHDERDYSVAAIGFTGDIVGTRTDQLHCDDLQSVQTLGQTERMVEKLRQDWFTRPGERGRTTMNGTRVGDGDVYEELTTQFGDDPIFKLIKIPALVIREGSYDAVPLWPYDPKTKTGYTLDMLERMRKKVGDEAWARNYMQQPRAKSSGTFTESMIDECKNYARRAKDVAVPGAPWVIALDPALGGVNCLMSLQFTPEKLYVVDIVEDRGLQRNEQIMVKLEAMVLEIQSRGGRVTDLVIESMNFQLGLARDERLRELSEKYGFAMREHLTGVNKYAEDIGVPSMATSFIRHQVDLPYGDDTYTRLLTDQFRDQLLKWRMFQKGAKLRQDQVMALWFAHIMWDTRRRQSTVNTESFKQNGLPWVKGNAGLIVPKSAGSPFYAGAR
ncbi:MAG: LAGLIDADG family homing endonuclease [Candidatus Neomicrothrix subdominans]